jgi:serine/threonine protein kinase/tetratricopeptide (TPR) repeat protein
MGTGSSGAVWPGHAGGEFAGTERYELIRKLGEGGMGVVYEAQDRLRGRRVALKTLRGFDADGIYRIKQEFRALADASHPNLARLHELVFEAGHWFFTMELVEGVDLLRWFHGERPPAPAPPDSIASADVWSLRSGAAPQLPIGDEEETEPGAGRADPIPVPEILAPGPTPKGQTFRSVREVDLERLAPALAELVEGVMALHQMGRLHRDIKPSNALVTETGRVVLLDFGLVTPMYDQFIVKSTVQGMVCGTVAYMSPEQGAGEALGFASDWYSVGVILFEALTGRLPFTGTMFRVLMDKQRVPAPGPRDLVPDVPEHLDALCRALLAIDPGARPDAAGILEQLGRPIEVAAPASATFPVSLPGLFVGRHDELASMQAALQKARSGRAQVVLVEGRSGVGKTTLIRRFLDQAAAEDGVAVLSGRCHERELVPFKGLDGIIDALSRFLKRLPFEDARAVMPSDAPLIGRLFPVMERVEALNAAPLPGAASERTLPAPGVPATQELRRRAFDALRALLEHLARRTTLVLFLDDLQWGDSDSGELLAHVLAPPDPPPILAIGSYRVEDRLRSPILDMVRALEDAPRGLAVTKLALAPLSLEDAEDLARALLEEEGEPADARRRRAQLIALESGGDPMFVYELAQRDAEGQDLAAPVASVEATPVRQMRLEQVLFERIRHLPAPARCLLEVVALAGGPISVSVANAAAGLSPGDDVQADLLRAQRLLRSSVGRTGDPSAEEGDLVEVYHDRIRETLTRNLTEDMVRAHHLSVARVLLARPEPDPEALVLHLLGAREEAQAARYARTAAQAAFDAMAFERAASLFGTALELTPPEDKRRWQLLAWRAESLASAGRGQAAAECYQRAAQAVGGDQGFELRRRGAEQYLTSGHVDEGLGILQELLREVEVEWPASPAQAMRSVTLMRARVALGGLKFEAKPAQQIPRRQKQQIDVCWSLATGLAMVDFVRSAYFGARMLAVAVAAGDRLRAVRAMAVEGVLMGGVERSQERADRILRLMERTAEGVESAHAQGLVHFSRGFAAYLRAQWRRAEGELDAAIEIFTTQCTGAAWETNTARLVRVEALSNQGRYREVGQGMRRSMAQAAALGNRYVATTYRTFPYVTVAWLAADEPEQVRREVQDALQDWTDPGFHLKSYSVLVSEANVELYEGRGAEAWARVEQDWAALEGSLIPKMQLLGAEALFLRARAALAAAVAGGDATLCHKVASEAGKALAALPLGHVPGMVALIRAQKNLLRGREERARTLFGEARTAFEAADMAVHAAVARRREGELMPGRGGRRAVEEAERTLVSQGILRPERIVQMFAPVGAKPR